MLLQLINLSRHAGRPHFAAKHPQPRNLGVLSALPTEGALRGEQRCSEGWSSLKLTPSQWFLAQGKEERGGGRMEGGLPISFPEYSPISVRQKGLGFKAAALSGKEAGKFDCA